MDGGAPVVQSRKAKPQDQAWKSVGEDGRVYVTEGKATIVFPSTNSVFYNPVQEFNRDVSIAAITTWTAMYLRDLVDAKAKGGKVALNLQSLLPDDSKASTTAMSRVVNAYVDHFRELSEEELSVIDLNDPKYEDHQIRVLEALSATGLRSIRYAKDLPRISKIFANDLLPEAVRAITENCKHNGVEDIVQGNEGDANAVMYRSIGTPFEVIDLDPYGSASPFLDAAVQAVSDGGLLCITCTDMAVLAGSQSEACWAKYGGMSIPNAPYCHEMGLRLLVHAIQTSAAKYKRCIEPLLCLSIDFYVRVFVKVFTSAQLVKKTASKSSLVYHCTGCKSFVTQSMGKSVELGDGKKVGPVLGPKCGERCEHCDSRFHVGGPFWNGPLHNQEFVRRILKDVKAAPAEKYKTRSRILGMLTVASEELPIPFYYHVPSLAASLKCSAIPLAKICSALLNMGYKVSSSQCASNCFKTNAPGWAVWDVMRQNAKDVPIKNPSAVAKVILGKEIRHVVNWEPHPGANPESRRLKLVRYQENPTANWGPMERAGGIGKGAGRTKKDAEGGHLLS